MKPDIVADTTARCRVRETFVRALLAVSAPLILAIPLCAQEDTTAAAADTSRVYELTEVDQPPRPENVNELRAMLERGYPPTRLAEGTNGRVIVEMVVGTDGSPRELRVATSTDSAFDAPSLAAAGVLRFAPGALVGRTVATRVQIPIQWQAPVRDTAAQGGVAAAPQEVASERVYELREVEVEPRPRNLTTLRRALERLYPVHLRDSRIEGLVQVRFRVDANGVPSNFLVQRTSNPQFNQPTLEALAELRFSPARVARKAVPVWVELPIQWTVQDNRLRSPDDRNQARPYIRPRARPDLP